MDQLQQIRRTRGDGMENDSAAADTSQTPSNTEFLSKLKLLHEREKLLTHESPSTAAAATESHDTNAIPGRDLIYRQPDSYNFSPPAIVPKGKIFPLVPRLVSTTQKSVFHTREPKFVPMEPYKAAISPLVRPKRRQKLPAKLNRNNLDLNILVSHISDIRTKASKNLPDVETFKFDKERKMFEKQIEDLKKGKEFAEMQLKSQVQVNAELKHLLVAAVGEDLQTRVNVLTEDKLQLARRLLSTAQNLSTHTEQIEYLAGQSEVWRSKFLASSVMVEELARWKASLMQRNQLLLKSNKSMLETMATIRDMEIETLKNLKFMAQMKSLNLPSSNVLDITAECLNISQQLILHSGIGMPSNLDLQGLDTTTEAEKLSIQALQNFHEPLLMSTDEAFKAIVNQAFLPAASNSTADSTDAAAVPADVSSIATGQN